MLAARGRAVGGYYSPHVTGWAERIRVRGAEADFERAVGRVRPVSERLGATQFEALTAAALAEFASASVDVAVVEAGLGGRHDATNVLRAPVAVLTNVALEHTAVLGSTREAIAAEKLAVVQPRATVVLGEPEWQGLAWENGAAQVLVETGGNAALAAVAASAFLRHPVEPVEVVLAGRFERRGDEIWDAAHNTAAVEYLAPRLPALGSIVLSVLADKDAAEMLRILSGHAGVLVATASSNERALPAHELAALARPYYDHVEVVPDPADAVARARELGVPVLVTGSFYLLADLAAVRSRELPCREPARN
jgi:dihydrofolate synthase/folylpolyglutamate synthase